jgi:hypothetical protein
MRRRRHPAVITMAVINIVFGGLSILCGGCGLALHAGLQAAGNAPGARGGPDQLGELVKFLNKECPGYLVMEVGRSTGVMVLGLVLVLAGVGLLYLQSWARWTTIAYAVLAILLHLIYGVYETAVVVPARTRFQATHVVPFGQMPPPGYQEGQQVGAMVGVWGVIILAVVHGAANLIVLLLPGVGAAFAGRGTRRRREEEYEEDEEDYDDRRPRRRRRPAEEDDDWSSEDGGHYAPSR